MKVELLQSPGCEHSAEAQALVREVLGALAPTAAFAAVMLGSEAEAAGRRFAGSPTVLVDEVDLEPDAPRLSGFG